MTVAELARYRERRTVRRVGAVALVTVAILGGVGRVKEAWEAVEWAIRTAAGLLPEPDLQEDP